MSESPDAVEERTRLWLEGLFLQSIIGVPSAQSVWGENGGPLRFDRAAFHELHRRLKIFRWLDRLRFESFIDIGSGFEIYPALVRCRYAARTYYADFSHSFNLPYGGAASDRLDRAITLNAARLPFADDSFDVVLASEVLEHLVRPCDVIAELVRVSRKYVVMTSLEALSFNRWERFRQHLSIDVRQPHVERNFLLLDEFDAIFGPDWHHENLLFDPDLPASIFAPTQAQDAACAALRDVPALIDALCRAVACGDHRLGAVGIVLVKVQGGAPVAPLDRSHDAELATWLIEQMRAHWRHGTEMMRAVCDGRTELTDPARPISADLLRLLRCPNCRREVDGAGATVRCTGCGAAFRVECGVPIMYPTRIPDGPEVEAAVLQRLCGADARRRRVVRRVMRRLRRNEGPPALWRRAARRLLVR